VATVFLCTDKVGDTAEDFLVRAEVAAEDLKVELNIDVLKDAPISMLVWFEDWKTICAK